MQALGVKVATLRDEARAVLANPTAAPERKNGPAVGGKAGATAEASSIKESRRPIKGLRVTLSNGTVIREKRALETFVRTIQTLGLARVADAGVVCRGLPLVHQGYSDAHRDRGECSMMEVDGYVVVTHSSTELKKRQLDEISRKLGDYISVQILE